MENKKIRIQVIILFLLILANFIAQIPYYLHLYYNPSNPFAQARGILLMLFVFVVFLLASVLFFQRKTSGYWLLVIFLAIEFLFYLWNTMGEVLHGYGLFFHLNNPNLLLKVVFAIGYVNLFASGYFLGLLLFNRGHFFPSQERAKPLTKYSA